MSQISRRRLLASTTGALGMLSACGAAPAATPEPTSEAAEAGITRPAVAQAHCELSIWDVSTDRLLGPLGERMSTLPDDASLTVTVGLGPALVKAIDPTLPGTTDLPVFPGDQADARHRGGDLMLQVCADDPAVVSHVAAALVMDGLTPRWRQRASRGPTLPNGTTRNPLGFVDGIVVPRGRTELAANVWLDEPATVRGATIAVVRRMRLDMAGFLALPVAEQERIFGRRRDTSEPLSGSGEVDLGAKAADGRYLIPADAHVRMAHPLTSGSGLMLRRSYGYDNGPKDRGLLFISFQKDLRTFVATQYRLSEGDALMRYATTTGSGTFLVLPGLSH